LLSICYFNQFNLTQEPRVDGKGPIEKPGFCDSGRFQRPYMRYGPIGRTQNSTDIRIPSHWVPSETPLTRMLVRR